MVQAKEARFTKVVNILFDFEPNEVVFANLTPFGSLEGLRSREYISSCMRIYKAQSNTKGARVSERETLGDDDKLHF